MGEKDVPHLGNVVKQWAEHQNSMGLMMQRPTPPAQGMFYGGTTESKKTYYPLTKLEK